MKSSALDGSYAPASQPRYLHPIHEHDTVLSTPDLRPINPAIAVFKRPTRASNAYTTQNLKIVIIPLPSIETPKTLQVSTLQCFNSRKWRNSTSAARKDPIVLYVMLLA